MLVIVVGGPACDDVVMVRHNVNHNEVNIRDIASIELFVNKEFNIKDFDEVIFIEKDTVIKRY